ncbi:hypothetical protein [Actinoplanes palleronii]|nr:hypothetical protein [Actinoplanes palleronii]
MVAEMLLHEPAPVAIWGALWLATVPAMVVLASPAGVRNPGRALLDACAFLIGRPNRRPAAPEPAPSDFFATGPVSAGYALETVFSYPAFAAEVPVPAGAVTYAGPAVAAGVAVSAGVRGAISSGPVSLATAVSAMASSDSASVGIVRVVGASSAAGGEAVPSAAVPLAGVAAPSGAAAGGGLGAGGGGDAADRAYQNRVFADLAPVRPSLFCRFFQRAAARRAERLRRATEALKAVRYADEVRVAAEQAGYAADRWQENWEAASERVDASFRAWQSADSRLRRSREGTAFGTPFTGQTPAEYADRERHLHLAVRAAAERGELPTSAVADALTGRGGWNARLHPVEQELVIQRASATHLEAVWKRAVEAESAAWADAQTARRDWQSLCQESIVATAHATAVHHLLPTEPPTVAAPAHPAAVARVA